jgi:NAD(P)-dependent dehydrogenase (short-subunit alcohol dehydrogenase family)
MSIELDGAVAVITGAGSGIGRASAMAFAGRGANVVVTDIDEARAASVADEIGERAVGARCDVTSKDDLEAARDLALERFGRVDLVMNNVGICAAGDPLDIPMEAWERSVDVNLLSVVRSNEVFLPLLLDQGSGHVVNTASTGGLLPYGWDRLPYTATKFAVVGMSEALAVYLRPKGIGVTCLCPAVTATNMFEQVTMYGPLTQPSSPGYESMPADVVGEMLADAVEANRFLVVPLPKALEELREKVADIDAYLDWRSEALRS